MEVTLKKRSIQERLGIVEANVSLLLIQMEKVLERLEKLEGEKDGC